MKTQVLEQSRDLVNKIYENMSIVESCEVIVEKARDLPVCFHDGEKAIMLDGVLSNEQVIRIREGIVNEINKNCEVAENFLMSLHRKPATINREFDDAINEIIESGKKNQKDAPEKEQNIEQLIYNAYVTSKMTVVDTAKSVGKSQDFVRDVLKNNGWNRNKGTEKKEYEFTVEDIAKLYLVEGVSVKEIAKKYNCSTSAIYACITDNNLKKPSKSDKDFRPYEKGRKC